MSQKSSVCLSVNYDKVSYTFSNNSMRIIMKIHVSTFNFILKFGKEKVNVISR